MRRLLLIPLIALLAFADAPPQRTFVVPAFRDLKLKVRHIHGLGLPQLETYNFKGARQRIDRGPEGRIAIMATILQCDQRTSISLHEFNKTYFSFPMNPEPARPLPRPKRSQADGPEVLVTIDAVDTGERRQMGSFDAQHIKTTASRNISQFCCNPVHRPARETRNHLFIFNRLQPPLIGTQAADILGN